MSSSPYNDAPPKKRRRLLKLLLIYAVIAIVGYGLGSFLKYDKNPEACGGCHAMQPQVKTWQVTAHNNIDCVTCHEDLSMATFKFREGTGRYRLPIENTKFMEDDVCLQCHNPKRIVTPPGDLVIPHTLHMEKGVDCIDCHEAVVHANVNKEVMTEGLDPGDFTLEMAQELTEHGNRIPMDKCMQCHNGAKAPRDCNVCHTDKQSPPSHDELQWGTGHGREAFKNINSCNECHEYNLAKKQAYDASADPLINVQREARTNGFCYNCHIQRPVTHTKVYSVDHPDKAREFAKGCLACHNKEKEPETEVAPPTTNVYCEQCHFTLHPSNWQIKHPEKVRADGDATCYSCHAATSCASCHSKRK
ncbi:NapC/NirT family cytochrome c [Metallumcola ferriviriculae]|uniref:NapC/NirT family cytochrome c n=1 Tax=Metallumcola ferriviriculae TaxID=3039180 RepID=A0AAU0UNR1_9FIRM|nr:NapC/NirT family cytochrome c [Desulfitibacteraceae bacterium MK1]